MHRNYDFTICISKYFFILRRFGAANFVDITKIVIMMTKTTIKNFLEKNVLKYNFYRDSSMY